MLRYFYLDWNCSYINWFYFVCLKRVIVGHGPVTFFSSQILPQFIFSILCHPKLSYSLLQSLLPVFPAYPQHPSFSTSKFQWDWFFNFLTSLVFTPGIYKISSTILKWDDICEFLIIIDCESGEAYVCTLESQILKIRWGIRFI